MKVYQAMECSIPGEHGGWVAAIAAPADAPLLVSQVMVASSRGAACFTLRIGPQLGRCEMKSQAVPLMTGAVHNAAHTFVPPLRLEPGEVMGVWGENLHPEGRQTLYGAIRLTDNLHAVTAVPIATTRLGAPHEPHA